MSDTIYEDPTWPPVSWEVWADADSDGLRDYVRKEWPVLADALDSEWEHAKKRAEHMKALERTDGS